MTDPTDLPSGLTVDITDAQAATGVPAAVETLDPGRWRITYADTTRVRCTVEAAAAADPAAYLWLGSELWVDGARRFLAPDPQGLAALIADPDSAPPPAEIHIPTVGGDVPATVPAIVRHHLKLLAARIDADIDVVAVHDLAAEWRVNITAGDVYIVLSFRSPAARHGSRPTNWRLASLVAFYDGAGHVLTGGLGALLALLTGRQATPTGPSKAASAAPAARNGSVEVRRASVIRV